MENGIVIFIIFANLVAGQRYIGIFQCRIIAHIWTLYSTSLFGPFRDDTQAYINTYLSLQIIKVVPDKKTMATCIRYNGRVSETLLAATVKTRPIFSYNVVRKCLRSASIILPEKYCPKVYGLNFFLALMKGFIAP